MGILEPDMLLDDRQPIHAEEDASVLHGRLG